MFQRFRIVPFFATIALVFFSINAPISTSRAEITTLAEFAIIMDFETGAVLFEKNADAPMKPASMAKMMTIYMAFEDLKSGSLGLEDTFQVSIDAWKKGGSRTFLEPNSHVTVADLLRGVIVQSGNDAAIVIAESLNGSEDAFAEAMTDKAKELGMHNTVFGNSTGWPDARTTTTARDLAILARALITEFPDYYHMFKEESFTYNNIKQGNRNPLIYSTSGADGLKTGHTEESGYGLVGTALRGEQRVLLVVNGLDSSKTRARESKRLIDLAFRVFNRYELVQEGEILGYGSVWLGRRGIVPLTVGTDIVQVLTKASADKIGRTTDWPSSISAPIQKGQALGQLHLNVDGKTHRFPLVAAETVEALPYYRYPDAYLRYLIFGMESKAVGNE